MFIWMTEWGSGHVCRHWFSLLSQIVFQVCRDKTQNWYVTAASQIWNDDVAENWQADNCKAGKAERGTTGRERKENIKYLIFSSSSLCLCWPGSRWHWLGIKIQAGGGVSWSKSELSWIITSGAQWLGPASITRKLSRQKTPGKKSPGTGKSESNWQSWNMENISYGVWRPMLRNCLSRAGLGRCRPTL